MVKRLIITFCAVLTAFTILYVRVSNIALDNSLSQVAADQSVFTVELPPTRGMIYDCRMFPLVDANRRYVEPQVESKSVSLIPSAEGYGVSMRYSGGQLAQHIIGYEVDNHGVTGIEREYDELLNSYSTSTKLRYSKDGTGRIMPGIAPDVQLASPVTGGVVLTIDKRLQTIVEDVGRKLIKRGAIVMLDPYTGKVRAAASFPGYSALNIADAMKSEDSPLINRCNTPYSVGSIFKLVTAATALSSGISSTYCYDCAGSITLGEVTFGCHRTQGHGELDMSGAMAASCNPYFINLSTQLDRTVFINMARDLSFGRVGNLPTVEQLRNAGDVANLAFGQGSLTATPMEVATLIGSIVNGGNTILPTLVEGTTENGKDIQAVEAPYPIKAMHSSTASKLKAMMVTAVMDTPNQNAKPTYATAGGKTSTAQSGQFVEGREILQGWFAGFFPADRPQYVAAIVVEDAVNGNADASPVFKAIADSL